MNKDNKRRDYRGKDFSALPHVFLDYADNNEFENADLRGANFQGLKIKGVNFNGSKLQSANFEDAKISDCTFNYVRSGLSELQTAKLSIVCLFLSFLAGLIASYSAASLIYTILYSFNNRVEKGIPALVCAGILAAFLLIGICMSILIGIRILFGIFFIGIVLAGVTITSLSGNGPIAAELALNSSICMAFVIGGFVSVLVQSQSIYTALGLGSIRSEDPNYFWAGAGAVLGVSAGTLSALQSVNHYVVFGSGIFLMACGYALGKRGHKEKKNEQEFILKRIEQKFILVRQIPDHLFRVAQTSFKSSEFERVRFVSAKILNADFTNCEIKGFLDITKSDVELLNSGELAGSDIKLLSGGAIKKGNKVQRPPTEDIVDREKLFDLLVGLPSPQFEKVLFLLKIPPGNVGARDAPQGNRVSDLLNWAESEVEYGIKYVWSIANVVSENTSLQ